MVSNLPCLTPISCSFSLLLLQVIPIHLCLCLLLPEGVSFPTAWSLFMISGTIFCRTSTLSQLWKNCIASVWWNYYKHLWMLSLIWFSVPMIGAIKSPLSPVLIPRTKPNFRQETTKKVKSQTLGLTNLLPAQLSHQRALVCSSEAGCLSW